MTGEAALTPAHGIVTSLTVYGFAVVTSVDYRINARRDHPPSKPAEFRRAPLPPKGARHPFHRWPDLRYYGLTVFPALFGTTKSISGGRREPW